LSVLKGFVRWMERSRRLEGNPLGHVDGVNPRTDVRLERRGLSAEELGRLFAVAEKGPEFRHVSGRDRSMLYMLASYTGLRVSELASLTRASFHLNRDPPTVTVAAGGSEGRRDAGLP